MAISKEILNNKKKKTNSTNTPKPLGTVPANNPEHVSAPADFHHPIPPKPILYNSFEEAVNACEQIFLKPGEAHTEFYQINGIIHCVVGIGNYNSGYRHLYLTDSGDTASISDQLNAMNEQVTLMGKKVDNVYETLTEKFDALQETVNDDIDELNSQFNDLSTNVNNQLASMQLIINQTVEQVTNISEKVNDISAYVDGFDERIQQNTNDISALTNRVVEIENWKPIVDNSINQLKIKTDQLDSSIIELHDLINEFEPIDTSSIRSLFHDDIWTVNLCCYTAAGHVEIFDDIAGEKWGGDSSRVAECTPFNEYKTYVEGDDVSFMAVPNEGYKFVNWFYGDGHSIVEYADTSIINLEFGQSDIPVIGTLGENANPAEPAILLNGYTAFFRKLHEVKWSIDTSCNTNQHLIEYFDDKIKVRITEKDRTSKEYIIDNNYTGKIYFDDGAKVEITALPSEDGHHTFEYYVLNESSEKTYNNPIIITDAIDDIIVDTYFKEWWINIQTEPHPNVADITVPEGSDMYHLRGDILHINIENIQEDWQFEKWSDTSISDSELARYIIEGDLTTPNIIVQVNASISSGKYDLIANFTQQEIHYYNVSFYSNNELWHNEPRVRQNTMLQNIQVTEPSSTGYTFKGWMVDNIIEPSTYQINANTRFDASFGINQYNVTFYIDGELKKGINVDYNTPFNTIEKPEHTKQGYDFLGWENAETGELWQDDNTTPIVEDSMFDASYNAIQIYHDVTFWLEPGVRYTWVEDVKDGSTLGELRTIIGDPTKEEYNFDGWMINDIIKDNNYPITEDTSFYASFSIKQFTVQFDLNNETGGIIIKNASYGDTVNEVWNEPDPTYEGHIFVAWQVDGDDVPSTYEIKEDTVFVARYEEQQLWYLYDMSSALGTKETSPLQNFDINDVETWINNSNLKHITTNIFELTNVGARSYGYKHSLENLIEDNLYGLKFGNSSNTGSITFKVNKDIKFVFVPYSSNEKSMIIKYGESASSLTNTYTFDNLEQITDYNKIADASKNISPEIPAESYVTIQSGSKRGYLIGYYLKENIVSNNNVGGLLGSGLLASSNIKQYLITFDGGNAAENDDYYLQINEDEQLLLPLELNINEKSGYEFKGWRCITDPTFEFGVTSVTQNLEFEPIWEPI